MAGAAAADIDGAGAFDGAGEGSVGQVGEGQVGAVDDAVARKPVGIAGNKGAGVDVDPVCEDDGLGQAPAAEPILVKDIEVGDCDV